MLNITSTTGVCFLICPNHVKSLPIIKLLGADRLDNNNNPHPNGYFDYVEGYTISNGRVFFPLPEPFGAGLRKKLIDKGVTAAVADKLPSRDYIIRQRQPLSRLQKR